MHRSAQKNKLEFVKFLLKMGNFEQFWWDPLVKKKSAPQTKIFFGKRCFYAENYNFWRKNVEFWLKNGKFWSFLVKIWSFLMKNHNGVPLGFLKKFSKFLGKNIRGGPLGKFFHFSRFGGGRLRTHIITTLGIFKKSKFKDVDKRTNKKLEKTKNVQ